MSTFTCFVGFLVNFLNVENYQGGFNQFLVDKLPIADPKSAHERLTSQIGEVRAEVRGLPVIFPRPPLLRRSGTVSVTVQGTYPTCLDTVESEIKKKLLEYLSQRGKVKESQNFLVEIALYDNYNSWSIRLGTINRWVRYSSAGDLFGESFRPNYADMVYIYENLESPYNSRFWLKLGDLWEVHRAALDFPWPQGSNPRSQIFLLVRPECGEVIFPFFAVADSVSVLWVEASPRFFGRVLPWNVYLRVDTKKGHVRITGCPNFWKKIEIPKFRLSEDQPNPFSRR